MKGQGVVAAGHKLTAEAGADVLREGGNAVDAAIASVLTSFAVESPLTGLGAGGFMLIHIAGGDNHLLDFFVQVPGRGADHSKRRGLVPVDVIFDETPQVFNIGAASCGVYGTPAGIHEAAQRFGSVPLEELARPAISYARDGCQVSDMQGYIFRILEPIMTEYAETAAIYAPQGRMLREGETIHLHELADGIERLVQEGPEPFYRGDIAKQVEQWIGERGGVITAKDLASYQVIERSSARASYRGREVLTNPPPSSGGILIAYSLDLLERQGPRPDVRTLTYVMQEANNARTEEFNRGLYQDGFLERFLSGPHLEEAAGRIAKSHKLGSTTHISVIDAKGNAVSVTCSNGTGSGMLVPGTGIHLNNMLGEEDLNPLGFHTTEPGRRVTSMMAPTVVLRDGSVELALGSAGSNRLRSAILQTIMNVVDHGLSAEEAVRRGRVHFEEGVLQAEPGVDGEALRQLEEEGFNVARWRDINLYFGGVQACARDPETGALSGGGDPRRGGAAAVV